MSPDENTEKSQFFSHRNLIQVVSKLKNLTSIGTTVSQQDQQCNTSSFSCSPTSQLKRDVSQLFSLVPVPLQAFLGCCFPLSCTCSWQPWTLLISLCLWSGAARLMLSTAPFSFLSNNLNYQGTNFQLSFPEQGSRPKTYEVCST